MTTSRKIRSSYGKSVMPKAYEPGELAYYRARLKNRLHQLVLREFENSGITRAELARRIRKKPEQITRWLNSPGNLRLDTVSDLLLGISFSEISAESISLKRPPRNFDRPNWLNQERDHHIPGYALKPSSQTVLQPQATTTNLSEEIRKK